MLNDARFIFFLYFVVFDVLSGLMKAIKTRTYKSSLMREGMIHKVTEVGVVIFMMLVDKSLPIYGYELDFLLANYIEIAFCFMEFTSILENAVVIYPKIGGVITKLLDMLKEKLEGGIK